MILEPNPNFGGGSEAVMLGLAQGLSKRGHAIYLAYETEGTMQPFYDRSTIEQIQMSLPGFTRRRPHRIAQCIRNIARVCRSRTIDVVLSSHLGFLPIAALTYAIHGVPFCFHLGLPCQGNAAGKRWAYRRVSAGVPPSDHTARTWRDAGWPENTLHVIPNWVDPDRFCPASDRDSLRRELRLMPDAFYIIFMGRIYEEKA